LQWGGISIRDTGNPQLDMQNFIIELNRRIRVMFSKIDISQITFNLNTIDGTLNLSKGGTGASLSAPASDKLMFYDLSEGKVSFLSAGNGINISGTNITANADYSSLMLAAVTTNLTIADVGVVLCDSATPITINLPTVVNNSKLSFVISNINAGIVTIDPFGAETIQGNASFDLYQDESLSIISYGTGWWIR